MTVQSGGEIHPSTDYLKEATETSQPVNIAPKVAQHTYDFSLFVPSDYKNTQLKSSKSFAGV